jgi:glycosyltransferase involved in cell wall biosynthesis
MRRVETLEHRPAATTRPIAFFLPSAVGGGAERVAINLIEDMTARGLTVDLVLATATGRFMNQLPRAARFVDLRAGRVITSVLPLARYIRKERPRVVVSSQSHANVVALWAARLARRETPVVVTEHNTRSQAALHEGLVERRMWPRLMRTFYPWAASVVAVSRDAADDFARAAGLPRERVEVVYNPVITPQLLELARQAPDHPWFGPGQPPVILGVGRLTPQKDFPTLLRAFAEVRREREVRLVILGEGEDRDALLALSRELGIGDSFDLPGFRKNAMAYMAASAMFVLSSAFEGLPTVLIEALATGTQVVSTNCPSGPREILQDGRLGTLVPVGDAAALAAAIRTRLDHPSPPAPAEALAPFTSEAAVDHYLRIIQQVSSRTIDQERSCSRD